jgi:hypothetical protein
MTTTKKTSKKKPRKRRSKETGSEVSLSQAKREKLRQKKEDLLAFRDRMKKFGQELLRRRRAELEESKSYKRVLL